MDSVKSYKQIFDWSVEKDQLFKQDGAYQTEIVHILTHISKQLEVLTDAIKDLSCQPILKPDGPTLDREAERNSDGDAAQ